MISKAPVPGKRNPITRMLSRMTPRGWTLLLVGGVISLCRGLFYFTSVDDSRVPAYLEYVTRIGSVSFYGIVWSLIGLFTIATVISAFGERTNDIAQHKMLPASIGLLVSINALWSLSFFIGQFQGGASDSIWLTGMSYAGFALCFWYMGTSIDVEEGEL